MGPGCSIFLRYAPTAAQLNLINSTIDAISSSRNGDDFWVNTTKPINGTIDMKDGAPFIVTFTDEKIEDYNFDEKELKQIKSSIGYRPTYSISFGAICNSDKDHRILGELSLYIAKTLAGHINFGGAIFSLEDLPWCKRNILWIMEKANWADIEPYVDKSMKNKPGQIHTILYKTSTRRTWAYHLCDSEFLEYWLTCPNFHMIK